MIQGWKEIPGIIISLERACEEKAGTCWERISKKAYLQKAQAKGTRGTGYFVPKVACPFSRPHGRFTSTARRLKVPATQCAFANGWDCNAAVTGWRNGDAGMGDWLLCTQSCLSPIPATRSLHPFASEPKVPATVCAKRGTDTGVPEPVPIFAARVAFDHLPVRGSPSVYKPERRKRDWPDAGSSQLAKVQFRAASFPSARVLYGHDDLLGLRVRFDFAHRARRRHVKNVLVEFFALRGGAPSEAIPPNPRKTRMSPSLKRSGSYAVTTILPKWEALSIWPSAATASSNLNVRSMTGFMRWSAMARFIASNMARLPTKIPCITRLRMRMGNRLSWPPPPASTPIMEMRPPARTARSDCGSVPAPPTSTT